MSIRNLAPLISPISTLGSPFGAAAQIVAQAKRAVISLIVEPPGIRKSIAGGTSQKAVSRRQQATALLVSLPLSAFCFLPSAFCFLLSALSIVAKTLPTPVQAPSASRCTNRFL